MQSIYASATDFMAAHPSFTDEQLTTAFMNTIQMIDTRPLISEMFRQLNRKEARAIEERERASSHQMPSNLWESPRARAAFSDFSKEMRQIKVRQGDGSNVLLGRMTVDQHRRRISMLRAQVAGTTRTIRQHEKAVALLEETGASCLDEAEMVLAAQAIDTRPLIVA